MPRRNNHRAAWPAIPLLVVFALALVAQHSSVSAIHFEEVAERAKLQFVTNNCPTENKNQPETMVAGIALLDYDGDGYLDIYFVNGAAIPSLEKENSSYWNRLFRNNGDGTFADVTEKAGVAGTGYGMGVAAADYDNDGRPDIFVANATDNQLFHNNGDGSFTEVGRQAGVAAPQMDGRKMWAVGAGWFDYNNDGLLDLFVVNYCKWTVNKDPVCSLRGPIRGYCHPKMYAPLHNTLYKNNGNGTFTDVSVQTGIAAQAGKGMGVSFADYDSDGFLDAFVTNDTTPNFLFHNLAGKAFEEVGFAAGVAYSADGRALSGMGSVFRDLNNDGRPDIWHTAVEEETFPFYVGQADGVFEDRTASSGLLVTRAMSGWSNGTADFDNDGWKDLFVARANTMDNVALLGSRRYPEPNSVFRNLGNGKFEEIRDPSLAEEAPHRGAALGDLDNDGKIDVVVSALGAPAKIFHNVSSTRNHWITLKLEGTRSNRMGLGAQIRLTTEHGVKQWNEATTAVGYAGSSDARVHFGLGGNGRVEEIEIRWPSGIRQVVHDVKADQIVTVIEAAAN